MEEAVEEGGRGRWSAAIGLSLAVLLLSVFDPLALVLLPMGILMIGLPAERRLKWLGVGVILWVMAVMLSGGGLAGLSRGWALMLGASYLALTLVRPTWHVLSRPLAAVGIALVGGGLGVALSSVLDDRARTVWTHYVSISLLTLCDLHTRMPESALVAYLLATSEQISALQSERFPALLALQSRAALALASWWVRRV